MTKIGNIIKDYLNSWVECEYCSDNPICKDCVEEEHRTHFH